MQSVLEHPARRVNEPSYVVALNIGVGDQLHPVAGITTNPTEAWMLQTARNGADAEEGVLVANGRKPLIDRDAKYSADWREFIEEQGMEVIRLPPKSPNLNAYAERFVRSIKEECLNRMIFIGEAALRRAVREFMAHYHAERNHQRLGNRLIRAEQPSSSGGLPGGTTSTARRDAELLSVRRLLKARLDFGPYALGVEA